MNSPLKVIVLLLILLPNAVVGILETGINTGTFPIDYDHDFNTEDDCSIYCNCTKTSINCSDAAGDCTITRIPVMSPPSKYETITHLNMSFCNGLALNEQSFMNYTNLKHLTLYDCSLNSSSLPTVVFRPLSKLQFLDISHNELFPLTGKTPPEMFQPLRSLQQLRAYGTTGTYNACHGYPEQVLEVLTSLRELWIDGFNSTFGPTFRNLNNIEVLRISGDMIDPLWRSLEFCEIVHLSNESLENLIHVKRLSILKCCLERVDNSVFKNLVKLEYLDLTGNKCAKLDMVSKAMESLSPTVNEVVLNSIQDTTHMYCGNVMNKEMAEAISKTNISKLHLRHNAINSIDKNALSLLPKSLTEVHLSENEFEIGMYLFYVHKMPNLKFLDVSYNFFGDEYMIWRQGSKSFNNQPNVKSILESNTQISDQNYNGPLEIVWHQQLPANCPRSSFPFPTGSITVYLPPKLEVLHINNSKLGIPIIEFFFHPNNTIRKVDASRSLLYCWDGPIHGVEGIEEINLGHNGCSFSSHDFFLGFPNLTKLNIQSNLLGTVIQNDTNGSLFRNNAKLKTLDLSFNHIQEIPEKFLQKQVMLEQLYVEENGLRRFDIKIKHMSRLNKINLRNNHIVTLHKEARNQLEALGATHNLTVLLQGNPIECYCDTLDFLQWVSKYMNTGTNLNVTIDVCVNATVKRNISSLRDLQDIIFDLEKACATYVYEIIGLVAFIVIVLNIIVGVIVHRFRWKIRYWYYVVRNDKSNGMRRDGYILLDEAIRFKYHVYVASVNEDIEFVMDSLKPKLTTRFKLFIQDDDIIAGQNMYSMIANAIHVSQIIVFVVSTACKDDDHFQMAVKFAQVELQRRGQPMSICICIFLNTDRNNSLPALLQLGMAEGEYLDFPADSIEQVENVFWQEFMDKIQEMINGQIISMR